MYDYTMDENVLREQRDFASSSNVPSAAVDSGLEMSNDSDGSNPVTQNDNNLSTSRMPIPYANLIDMFRHDLTFVSDDSSRRISKERWKTDGGYNKTSCTIEEIDQPASSLSKDVFDSSYSSKRTFPSAQLTPVVSARNSLRFAEARVMRSCLHTNEPYIVKRKKLQASFKRLNGRGAFSLLGPRGAAIKHRIRINLVGEKQMCSAASTNNVEAVECLLNIGVSPNCRDAMDRTPLHLAGGSGYSSMVKLLLEHGADANLYDIAGRSALQAAITSGDKSSITLLNKAVGRPNPRFRFEITTGFPSSNTDASKLQVCANTDNCWTNDARGFDQQVEALSNVCSRLSFSNSVDEFQGSS